MNKKALSLAVCMALSYPGAAFALGLGEIESASHLNQPFNAKIDLLSTNGSDISKLKVKVASPSVFSRVGIDRPNYLNSLRFRSSIQGGKPVILVSSDQPIREPFINFLLEVSWPKGQLLKEYTVLLDPPVLMQPGTSVASNTAGVRPEPVNVAPQRQAQVVQQNNQQALQQQRQRIIAQQQQQQRQQQLQRQRQQQLQRQRQQQAQNNGSDGLRRPGAPLSQAAAARVTQNSSKTYRVRKGDTLYKIASKIGYQGVRTEQMVMALFEANPTAFRKRNINNLKAGVVMRRPSINEAKRISVSQARRDVRTQMSEWKAQRPTQRVATAKSSKSSSTATQSAADNTASQARIEVLGSAEGGLTADIGNLAGKAKLDALDRQLTLASESLTARKHENNELKSRVSELESLLKKKNRLITLKNEQLAELQVSLGKKPSEMTTGDESSTEIVDPIAEQGDGIQQTIVSQDGNEGTILRTDDSADAIINEAGTPEIFDSTLDDDTRIDQAMSPPVQPEEDGGILDLLSSPLVLGLGGGSLLALIGGLLFLRRRNAQDEYDEYSPIDFDDPSLAPGGSSGFDNDIGNSATTVDPSVDPFANAEKEGFSDNFQADPMDDLTADTATASHVTQAAPTPAAKSTVDADTQEDDILQEADVYIVYGLHEQAEVELKKAISKQPQNLEYRAKLLENYHASDNKEAFEAAATEFSQMQGAGKEALWEKVSTWGRKMIPGSPLFAGPGVAAATNSNPLVNPTPAASLDTSSPLTDNETTEKPVEGTMGGLGMAAGAAALGGVAVTAGKAIAENTQEGVGSLADQASDSMPSMSSLTEKMPSLDTFTADAPSLEDAKAEVLDFDEMDLESLLSADDQSDLSAASGAAESDALTVNTGHDDSEMAFDFSDFDLDQGGVAPDDSTISQGLAGAESMAQLDDLSDLSDLNLSDDLNSISEPLKSTNLDATSLNLSLDGSDKGLGKILPENSVYKLSENNGLGDAALTDDDDLSFLDLDEVDDGMAETQVSTKLDLARAYIDMGDIDGAKTTLQEVIAEGNDHQRQEAQALLKQAS